MRDKPDSRNNGHRAFEECVADYLARRNLVWELKNPNNDKWKQECEG